MVNSLVNSFPLVYYSPLALIVPANSWDQDLTRVLTSRLIPRSPQSPETFWAEAFWTHFILQCVPSYFLSCRNLLKYLIFYSYPITPPGSLHCYDCIYLWNFILVFQWCIWKAEQKIWGHLGLELGKLWTVTNREEIPVVYWM